MKFDQVISLIEDIIEQGEIHHYDGDGSVSDLVENLCDYYNLNKKQKKVVRKHFTGYLL